jgi:hypothetical protein
MSALYHEKFSLLKNHTAGGGNRILIMNITAGGTGGTFTLFAAPDFEFFTTEGTEFV